MEASQVPKHGKNDKCICTNKINNLVSNLNAKFDLSRVPRPVLIWWMLIQKHTHIYKIMVSIAFQIQKG